MVELVMVTVTLLEHIAYESAWTDSALFTKLFYLQFSYDFTTNRRNLLHIYVKLFHNTSINDKVMDRTRSSIQVYVESL